MVQQTQESTDPLFGTAGSTGVTGEHSTLEIDETKASIERTIKGTCIRQGVVASAKESLQTNQSTRVWTVAARSSRIGMAIPLRQMGLTIYAVGDIHGRADLLDRIHQLIDKDKADSGSGRNVEIYLGDYIDRGPDSATVISRLIERSNLTSTVFLRGNHEQLLMDFLHGKDCWPDWRVVGCIPCCLSYGISPHILFGRVSEKIVRQALEKNMPPEHVKFYGDTGSYCSVAPYLFVHAGIRPGIRLKDQNPADFLSIRKSFLEFEGDLGCVVVHGHTPVDVPDIRQNRINIDTGAFATNRLTCLRIDCNGPRVLTL